MACPAHESKTPPSLIQNGQLKFQSHHVGWIISGLFTLAASVASAWLVQKHIKWYSCKPQQRHIVRLLFMVPIYAIITLASYISYAHATSLILIRDGYEAVVLASFFTLLLEYLPGPVHPSGEDSRDVGSGSGGRSSRGSRRTTSQVDEEESEKLNPGLTKVLSKPERATAIHKIFYQVPMHVDPSHSRKPLKWIWPLGRVRARPKDGLSYLHWMKWGVLQYCIVRPGTTLAAVILQQYNLYCEASWSWRLGHVWVVTIVSISVTIAMYCLIQLYTTISSELKPYRPLLKLFAVKAVVFLTFWQGALLSGLASLDIIKDGEYMTAEEIVIGFAAILQTFEMMCFAFLHVKAFSYVPYKRIARARTSQSNSTSSLRSRRIMPTKPTLPPDPKTQLPASGRQQLVNLVQAFTFTDTWRDLRAGVLYFFGKGASREADEVCRRDEGFKEVFGRERPTADVAESFGVNTEAGLGASVGGERSFFKVRGYKGLPQTTEEEDKYTMPKNTSRRRPGLGNLKYSSLPTPPQDGHEGAEMDLEDPPPESTLRTVGAASGSRTGGPISNRLWNCGFSQAPPPEPVPPPRGAVSPPPRGAYVPAYGPGPSFSWKDGRMTPPHTPPRGTHISPSAAQVLAQNSPLFQQSFEPRPSGRPLPHPLSPVSPTLGPGQKPSPARDQRPSPTRRFSASSPTRSTPTDRVPPSREDSLLARVFSSATWTTDSKTLRSDGDSPASLTPTTCQRLSLVGSVLTGDGISLNTDGSSADDSFRTGEAVSVQPARAVSLRTGAPVLVRLGDSAGSASTMSWRTPPSPASNHAATRPDALPPPPEIARPLRRMDASLQIRMPQPRGPRIKPRTIVLPAPLSPARYPHTTWRTAPSQAIPTIVDQQPTGLSHVPSVHVRPVNTIRPVNTVRPVHWAPIQPSSASSSESGLAGRAAGRSSIGATLLPNDLAALSSLSSLSNIEDRYPTVPRRNSRDTK